MACSSEYHQLASHNEYIANLEKQGYELDYIGGHLIIYGIPYLNEAGDLCYGDIASPVDQGKDYLIDKPSTHQVWFNGTMPYGLDGTQLRVSAIANPRQIVDGLSFPISFSCKLEGRNYNSFSEKMDTYVDLISTPAVVKYEAPPQRGIETKAAEVESPLNYPDSMSGRSGINDLSHRLLRVRVGIVGLGGTGSYILDFISKTHLAEIRIFDDDIIHVHTLFRMPGALGKKVLGEQKVEVLKSIYSDFHSNITVQNVKLIDSNLHLLEGLDFVFVAVDDAPSRKLICRYLHENKIIFVDVGMGLYRSDKGLNGMVRATGGSLNDGDIVFGTEYLPEVNPVDNEYRTQPQISELNAMNAAMSVIRFKQEFNFFDRIADNAAMSFELCSLEMDHFPSKETEG